MNTAIDFYSRGKEKEAEARDYSTSQWYPRGRFICPECGEEVCLTKSKYKNFFRHYKRTAQTPECERRVDSVPSESIYERIGLLLYVKECNSDKDPYQTTKSSATEVRYFQRVTLSLPSRT